MDNVLSTGDDLSECDEPVAKLSKDAGGNYYLHVAFEAGSIIPEGGFLALRIDYCDDRVEISVHAPCEDLNPDWLVGGEVDLKKPRFDRADGALYSARNRKLLRLTGRF